MAASIVRAIDQDAAHAHVAHFAEGDFLGPPSGANVQEGIRAAKAAHLADELRLNVGQANMIRPAARR